MTRRLEAHAWMLPKPSARRGNVSNPPANVAGAGTRIRVVPFRVLVVALVALIVFIGLIAIVASGVMRLLDAKGESDRLALAASTGDVSSLGGWSPELIGLLSRDLEGSSLYFRPMGGARTSKVAAAIPAWNATGRLVLLSAESTPERGEQKIALLTRGVRIGMILDARLWQIFVDGRYFGTIEPQQRLFLDGNRQAIGGYNRDASGWRVALRGEEIAIIDGNPALHEKLPVELRPLIQLARPITPESSVWLLALTGVVIASASFVGAGAPLIGVP